MAHIGQQGNRGSRRNRRGPLGRFGLLLSKISSRPPFRLILFGLVSTGWFATVLVCLWDYQVRRAEHFNERARKQHEGTIEIRAARGVIYDRLGEKLAFSTPALSIGVFPDEAPNPELAASLLSEVFGTGAESIRAKLARTRFQWIKRLAEPGEAERVRNLNLSGIHFEKESKRYYPHGTVASHLLGAVGIDHNGQAGLEQSFDSLLKGEPGKRLVQYDAKRKYYSGRVVKEPVPGADLVLTIDHRIQMMAERELARAIAETQSIAGTIVVMDPSNGDLLANANWPTFDPNERVRDVSSLGLRRNFAVSSLIEPGSTFKVIPVSAAIEEGLAAPDEVLDCQLGAIYIGRRRVRDHKPFGMLTVGEILAKSSNVGAIKLGLRLEPERLYDYAVKFGFGQATGLPLPGETAGLLRPVEKWNPGSIGSLPIGQEIGVTAMQMARAVSVVANGGLLPRPTLVQSISYPDGRVEQAERKEPERVLSAKTAAVMRAMMEDVVQAGTGRLAQTAGYRVGGKTGTAQKVDPETGAYSRKNYVPSFVGFAPVNDPSIVIVVVLDSPVGKYYGGSVAAPVFPRVATQALRFRDVPPDLPITPPPAPPQPVTEDLLADFAGTLDEETLDGSDGATREIAAGEILVAAMTPSLPFGNTETAALPAPEAPANTSVGAEQQVAEWESNLEAAEAPFVVVRSEPVDLTVAPGVVPDFSGKTVREVVALSTSIGLAVDMRGTGFALRQFPAPGSAIQPGRAIAVEFSPSVVAIAK